MDFEYITKTYQVPAESHRWQTQMNADTNNLNTERRDGALANHQGGTRAGILTCPASGIGEQSLKQKEGRGVGRVVPAIAAPFALHSSPITICGHLSPSAVEVRAETNFYPVRYFWRDCQGKEHSNGSVASGESPAEALRKFQAAHRHVKAELVEESAELGVRSAELERTAAVAHRSEVVA